MNDAKDDPASPVCYLPETDDIYAGYLTKPEVAALLWRWYQQAPSAAIAAQFATLLPGDTQSGEDEGHASAVDQAQLRAEIIAILPRIRDDELHRRLCDLAHRL
jgi:hypothetical protein